MRSNFKANFCHTVSFIALMLPMLAILFNVVPAHANGGAGGGGGEGGQCSSGAAGANNFTGHVGLSETFGCGGGGGGGGAGGGAGGSSAATDLGPAVTGGAGGTLGSPNGSIGGSASSSDLSAGGGGGGGYNGNGAGAATINNAGALTGGNGGAGGAAYSTGAFGGGGGGGGAGGYGAVITGSGSSSNSGTISGGTGGAGGAGSNGSTTSGSGGGGGDGGVGVHMSSGSTLTNTGAITGGAGGAGGAPGSTGTAGAVGSNGLGGAGIVGSGITVINNLGGSISGGLGGDGTTQANAITFTGGSNTLTLGGGTFTGNIDVTGSVTFNQSTARTLFNNITGSGSVIDNGTGNLTLSGTNTYTGGTTVDNTELYFGSGSSFGTGAITLQNNGGIFGASVASLTNNITIGTGGGYLVSTTGTNFSGNISGTGDLTIKGRGTTTLSGSNGSLFGTTTVSDGSTLRAGSTTAFSYWSVMNVASGGTLDLNGFGTNSFGLNGAGTVTNNGSSDATYTVGGNSSDPSTVYSFSGTLQDGTTNKLGFSFIGSSTEVLSGTNTYSGETVVWYGTLKAGAVNTFSPNSLLYIAGGEVAGVVDLNGHNQTMAGLAGEVGSTLTNNGGSAATLTLSGGQTRTFFGTVEDGSSAIGLTLTNSSTLTLSGSNTYSGATAIQSGTLIGGAANAFSSHSAVTVGASGTLDIGGSDQSIGSLAGSGTVTNNGSEAILTVGADNTSTTFSGSVQDGTGVLSLTKAGTGTLTLSGSNTYSGATIVSAGTLKAGATNALAAGVGISMSVGSTLDLGGFNQTIGYFYGSGTVTNSGSADATLSVTPDDKDYYGVIQDGAHKVAMEYGVGGIILHGTNTYSGGTIIDNTAEVQINNGAAFGTGTVANNGGTIIVHGNLQVANNIALTGANTFENFSASSTGIFSGTVSGSGSLLKQGDGTIILNGASNSFGGVTVDAGTLQIGDSSHTGATYTGTAEVGFSGTLSGHGTIAGNLVSYGVVQPGGSIGTLNVSSYTQNNSGTLLIEASPTTSSVLNVSGTAAISGKMAVSFDAGSYTVGHVYNFLTSGSLDGTFATVSGATPDGFVPGDLTYTGTDASFALVAPGVGQGGSALFGGGTTTMQMKTGDIATDSVLNQLFLVGQYGAGQDASDHAGFSDSFVDSQVAGGSIDMRNMVDSLSAAAKNMGGWFKASGSFGAVDSSSAATGFSYSSGGFMMGLDRMVAEKTAVGVAAGYDHSTSNAFSSTSATADADTRRLYVYANTKLDDVNLGSALGYSYSSVHTARYVSFVSATATADHVEQTVSLATQASQTFMAEGLSITPRAGFAYTHLVADSYSETGAGAFNTQVGTKAVDSLRPFIGAGVSEDFAMSGGQTITPEAHLKYAHELIAPDYSASVISSGISSVVAGNNPTRDVVSAGFGVDAKLSNDVQVFGAYDITIPTGNNIDHAFSAGVKMQF